MTPTIVLLNIIGGISLLLYGLRQIKRSVMRGYGASLRLFVAKCTANRILGFLAGAATTVVLQSAATVSMIMSTFLAQKMLPLSSAIAVVLGADVGVAIVAQVLTFNLSWVGPLLLFVGLMMISSFDKRKNLQNIGLMIFGIGLILFALGWIREASIPFKESSALPYLIKPLAIDPVMTMIVAALLTWIFHSVLAFIMLVVGFAAAGIVGPHVALLLVLGANIGNIFAPLSAAIKDQPAAIRLPFASLLMRFTAVILVLPFLNDIQNVITGLDPNPARQVVHFHLAFNLLIGALFLPLTPVVAWIVSRIIPDRVAVGDGIVPMYLDEKQMDTPVVALSGASRETLRVADMVLDMLVKSLEVFKTNNANLMRKVQEQDSGVDTLHRAIKHYMAKAMQMSLNKQEAQRHLQIINFATTLEHIGDAIDKSMMPMAERMIRNHRRFSPEGMAEIEGLFTQVIDSLRLAQTVFMSSDEGLARRLVEGKADVVAAERRASANHYARLNQGNAQSIETSSVHLDLLRDLQRINGDVVTVAYPILEATGELLPNRLTTRKVVQTSLEPDVME